MMSGVEQQLSCRTCQWNKLCIEPPTMTAEEVYKKIHDEDPMQELKPDDDVKKVDGSLMSEMLNAMFYSGKDTECHVCPVFAAKLMESPELSNKIRQFMLEQ